MNVFNRRFVSSTASQIIDKLKSKNFQLNLNKLSTENRQRVEQMMRVNQAGELGAVRIYQGQLSVLSKSSSGPLLKTMLEQEKLHRNTFNSIIGANNIRPTIMTPLWHIAGFSLGAVTALMGKETAMLCTEAVETEIGKHYNDQLRSLIEITKEMKEGDEELESLKEIIKVFRDEELEHLEHAVENDSHQAPFRELIGGAIRIGCKVAIGISERI